MSKNFEAEGSIATRIGFCPTSRTSHAWLDLLFVIFSWDVLSYHEDECVALPGGFKGQRKRTA